MLENDVFGGSSNTAFNRRLASSSMHLDKEENEVNEDTASTIVARWDDRWCEVRRRTDDGADCSNDDADDQCRFLPSSVVTSLRTMLRSTAILVSGSNINACATWVTAIFLWSELMFLWIDFPLETHTITMYKGNQFPDEAVVWIRGKAVAAVVVLSTSAVPSSTMDRMQPRRFWYEYYFVILPFIEDPVLKTLVREEVPFLRGSFWGGGFFLIPTNCKPKIPP